MLTIDCSRLEDAREDLKERTFKAISIFDEYIGYFQGLSNSIMRVADGVRKIRSHLVVSVIIVKNITNFKFTTDHK